MPKGNPNPTPRTPNADISEWTRQNFKKSIRELIRRTGKPAHVIMADLMMQQVKVTRQLEDGSWVESYEPSPDQIDPDRMFQMYALMTKFLPRESKVDGQLEHRHSHNHQWLEDPTMVDEVKERTARIRGADGTTGPVGAHAGAGEDRPALPHRPSPGQTRH